MVLLCLGRDLERWVLVDGYGADFFSDLGLEYCGSDCPSEPENFGVDPSFKHDVDDRGVVLHPVYFDHYAAGEHAFFETGASDCWGQSHLDLDHYLSSLWSYDWGWMDSRELSISLDP